MFENRRTSSGELFSQEKYTAAHRTLPMHSLVKVTNLSNGQSVFVKINDRCPKKGVIDLSYKAAKHILLHQSGTTRVRVEVMNEELVDLLNEQDSLFKIFNKTEISKIELTENVSNEKKDTIVVSKGDKYEDIFQFAYYIRLCTIEDEENSEAIIDELSPDLKNIAKLEKVYDEDYYYLNIGPFLSIKHAKEALKDLKQIHKTAYIVKKKEKTE